MKCPFCKGNDLREKMNQYVCNSCGKNSPRNEVESTIVPLYLAVKFRMGGNRALEWRDDELGPGEHLYKLHRKRKK